MSWDSVYRVCNGPSEVTNMICECLHKLGTLDYLKDRHPDTYSVIVTVVPVHRYADGEDSFGWKIFMDTIAGSTRSPSDSIYAASALIEERDWLLYCNVDKSLANLMLLVRDKTKEALDREVRGYAADINDGWERGGTINNVCRQAAWSKPK